MSRPRDRFDVWADRVLANANLDDHPELIQEIRQLVEDVRRAAAETSDGDNGAGR